MSDEHDELKQTYLGDGLYARFDGYQIWLETPQGNRVALEPKVIDNLNVYIEGLRVGLGDPDWAKQPDVIF